MESLPSQNRNPLPNASLWPLTTSVDHGGRLIIGGCDVAALAQQYGTPLYLFDEVTIRTACRACRTAFAARHRGTNCGALRRQGAAQCRNCADHRR
jgi:diaminopimelate decarboxylase